MLKGNLKRCAALLVAASALLPVMMTAAHAEPKAEVIHWWTSAGESKAVKVFADAFAAAGGTWIDAAVSGGDNARLVSYNRIMGGMPPTANQFQIGQQMHALVEQKLLADITPEIEANRYDTVIPAVLRESAKVGGEYYALPVSMQIANYTFYNPKVLEASGVDIKTLKNWDDLFAAFDKVKAAGHIPVAVGVDPRQLHALFTGVLLSVGGPDLYKEVLSKDFEQAMAKPEFKKVADTFLKLRGYIDGAAENRRWNEATAMVVSGKAAFNFMGDWAKSEISAAGLKPGVDIGCFMGVGYPTYQIIGDVFVFPKVKDNDHAQGQKLLIKTLLDSNVQIDFAKLKGSLPIAPHADVTQLDACSQKVFDTVFDPANQVQGPDKLISPDANGALRDAVTVVWAKSGSTAEDLAKELTTSFENAM